MSEDRYPRGKLNADDEGAVEVLVRVQDKTVIVLFRTPVAWIGLSRADALGFAAMLTKHAESIPCP